MADSRFISTVTYGGYDKADVVRRLDSLYERIYGLENELRETRLLLDSTKNGEEIRSAVDTILAQDRDALTQAQVKNEELTLSMQTAEETIRKNQAEIRKLKASLEETAAELSEANKKLAAAKSDDDAAALSAVFIEAKRSADMLESTAKEKADQLEKAAAEAAEKSIAHANDESAIIINDAQRKAAEIIADAKNAAGEMETAYVNMRATIFSEMSSLGQQLADFKDALMKFEEDGVGNLYKCEELLDKTQETLKEGGIPEFREDVKYAPEYPERPRRKADLESEEMKKRRSGLDKLRQMAESLTGSKDNAEDLPPQENETAPAADKNEDAQDNNSSKKSGKTGLSDLMNKAKALKDDQ